MNVIDFLEERGIVEDTTSDDLKKFLQKPRKIYLGIDPTADSLHLGHLAGVMMLAFFQNFGHTPVCVVGGATAMIGDPSGKDKERPLLDLETLNKNQIGITNTLKQLLDFEHPQATPLIVNNYDWFKDFRFIDFLREVGKNFRVSTMLAKESVKNRLKSEEGMSFTELTYQILQGYDFYHLYKNNEVSVQAGGSDQWGNITAGTELVRKLTGKSVFGITFPLLTRSDGKKFGKSESGAVWLSEERLSSYDLYQYLYGIPDDNVINLLKMLTFVPTKDILDLEEEMKQEGYEPNKAQRLLAESITAYVHGKEGLEKAKKVTESLRPGKGELNLEGLKQMSADIPNMEVKKESIVGALLLDVLKDSNMVSSKGEARRMITNGGVYINNSRVENVDYLLSDQHLLEGNLVLIGVGKKKKILLKVVN
jgi:tyrosyl-tRNA synthetase